MTGILAGKTILVVEDEYFIASDLKRALEREQATVLGPVPDLDGGLALAGRDEVDAAILDVTLRQATSYPIADALDARQVPYLFLTGYDGWALPAQCRTAPRVAKPFKMQAVIEGVGELLTAQVPA